MTEAGGGGPHEHLISVIMPTLDAADHVREAASSVLRQDGAPVELVVQDGGSNDWTLRILDELGDPRVSVESGPDKGLGQALNRAAERSSGDWLLWLNADDLMLPGALAVVAPLLDGPADVLCGDFAQADAQGEIRKRYVTSPLERRRLFRRGAYAFMGSVYFRREVLNRIGGFAEDLHYSADWDFCVRAADKSRSVRVPSVLVAQRYHPGSLSVHSPWRFFPEGQMVMRRHARGPVELLASALTIARIALYLATRRIWTSDLWRRVGPSSKRL